ncbi:MAG TPA: FMN-binding protein [Trebonia sp.]
MRRVILAICATAVGLVLLLSFKTQTQSGVTGASPAAALGSPAPGNDAASPSASASPAASGSAKSGTAGSGTAGSAAAKTVTGAAWPTIYGPVQVKITVADGKITAATAVEYPLDTPRDQQINSYAIPQLNAETVAAGSAQIDTVSGATYTSQGYVGSLQSALDKAGL